MQDTTGDEGDAEAWGLIHVTSFDIKPALRLWAAVEVDTAEHDMWPGKMAWELLLLGMVKPGFEHLVEFNMIGMTYPWP